MTPIRAALRLAAIFPNLLLAACGDETGSSTPEADSPTARIAIYAPGDIRRIDRLMPAFQSATGVGYSTVSGDATEPMSRADVYFSESFVDLWEMAEADLLRPVTASLNERVAASLSLQEQAGRPLLDTITSDPERRFLPLAAALRTVVFNPDLVPDDEIGTITDFGSLADERWKGRLCLSASRVDGNRLLVAYLISRYDVREAEIIVRRWLQNLAAAVYQSDAALFTAITAGDCALGILDLRLLGRAGSPAAAGFHTFAEEESWLFDVAGAGISRHAANPHTASELLGWLLTAAGNDAYALEWPDLPLSRESIETRTEVGMTSALARAASLAEMGFLLEEADLLIERAGYR